MAKKKSPVDAALEVARKVRVPKKPVKAKGKKTVPAALDWGPGIPEDKLAYLNDEEMALVQAKRGYKGKRNVNGIPAFPDPGDTAKGASSNSHLPDSGGGAGTRGSTGGGGAGGAGGGTSGAGGAGGQSSPSGPGGAGGQSSDKKSAAPSSAPTGGPSGGPTSAPARTESSSASTPPSTFGPRTSNMPGNPVSTAPSTHAYESALNAIARGSSIVGNPAGTKQFNDRVPQATPSPVSFSQSPTVSGPNRGLGSSPYQPQNESIFSGANSPLSSPDVTSYDPEREREKSIQAAKSIASSMVGPSVPAGTAHITPEAMQRQASLYGSTTPVGTVGVNPTAYSAPIGPTQSQRLAAEAMRNVFSGSPTQHIAADPTKYSSPVGPTQSQQLAADAMRNVFSGSPTQNVGATPNRSISPSEPSTYAPVTAEDIARTVALSNYAVPSLTPSTLGNIVANPNAGWREFSDFQTKTFGPAAAREINTAGTNLPSEYTSGFAGPPVTSSVATAPSGMAPVASAYPTNTPGSGIPVGTPSVGVVPASIPSVEVGEPTFAPPVGTYAQAGVSPSQQPAYDVSPSQASGMTAEQREAYLDSLEGARNYAGPPTPKATGNRGGGGGGGKKDKKPYLPTMPPWVNYSYLQTQYPEIAYAPAQAITDFNNYSATLNTGGRVGTSADAAIRLARQMIVSRNKTR